MAAPSTQAVEPNQASINLFKMANRVTGPIMASAAAAVLWADARGWLGLNLTQRGAAWIFMALMLASSTYFGYAKKWE